MKDDDIHKRCWWFLTSFLFIEDLTKKKKSEYLSGTKGCQICVVHWFLLTTTPPNGHGHGIQYNTPIWYTLLYVLCVFYNPALYPGPSKHWAQHLKLLSPQLRVTSLVSRSPLYAVNTSHTGERNHHAHKGGIYIIIQWWA